MILQEDTRQQIGKHDKKHAYFSDNNVYLVRCKLPVGDYAPAPSVSVDTKAGMDEIVKNICGKEHKRFINECKRARDMKCQLIILVENNAGIRDITDVQYWRNPRSVYSDKCAQGPQLQKAMLTISQRYGVKFEFCAPEDAGRKVLELIENEQARMDKAT